MADQGAKLLGSGSSRKLSEYVPLPRSVIRSKSRATLRIAVEMSSWRGPRGHCTEVSGARMPGVVAREPRCAIRAGRLRATMSRAATQKRGACSYGGLAHAWSLTERLRWYLYGQTQQL